MFGSCCVFKFLFLFLIVCSNLSSSIIIKVKSSSTCSRSFLPHLCSTSSESTTTQTEWGQSFIGQDVCGSRLNVDPFDEQGDKPDAWELMKARIDAALLRRNQELLSNDSINNGNVTLHGLATTDIKKLVVDPPP